VSFDGAIVIRCATGERIATAERSFSAMRRIKTVLFHLHATMSAERLNLVMVLHENREAANDFVRSTDVIMHEFILYNDT